MHGFMKRAPTTFSMFVAVWVACLLVLPVGGSTGWCAPAPAPEAAALSAREKQDLVRQGVEQYRQGRHDQAREYVF